MEFSSADFMKLSLQEVADLLIDRDCSTALCKGMVDGRLYSLYAKLEVFRDESVKH